VLDNGTAVCYETKSGKDVWQSRLSWKVSSSPLLIDSKVLVIDERGDAFVFAASPDGLKVLSRSKLGEPIFATPAIVKGKMYIRGDNHLFCIGK
jgi:outer membrane protein assembly factor BamB